MLEVIMLLFVIYQLKHFIADYPLQGKYMLGKFKPGFGFVLPLLAHVSVHGLFTFLIAFPFILFRHDMQSHSLMSMGLPPDYGLVAIFAGKLALFDMVCHFIMDRIKASPKLLGRFQAISKSEYEDYKRSVNDNMRESKHPECVLFVKNQDETFKKKFKSNVFFWWSLGLDQMVHHLTHYVIIYILVR